ncbi:hypothetical protein [Actinokineospora sp.]|uniref:hypothetical protein n=1 Tax=Actinokineospora sp. TaxID=1872133 RepID=UPI0040376499
MNDVIGTGNQRLLDLVRDRRDLILRDPQLVFPWRRPCRIKTLLVTDGGLDFGLGDFGLATFVDILLNDGRGYADFDLTLAHLRGDVSDAQVLAGNSRITRSIKGFRFDEPGHFTAEMYDEVWLFGIETFFHSSSYPARLANPGVYPAQSLGNEELRRLSAHMNSGRGIFATGDHGRLGIGLCGAVNRVRSMRYWDDFIGASGLNEVSMSGTRRNDSNQVGHDPGSQFSDQSDDIPQRLDLKLYSSYAGLLRNARYPHPVMCSRLGRIDVFPDHPHEGECRAPASLGETYALDGSREYPDAVDGSGPVSPEVVAWGRVPAGNTASSGNGAAMKQPTQAHSFGVVSTYDGHRTGVGRVVCDSTWHHFINVNLIGVVEGGVFDDFAGTPGTDSSKHDGFLSSASGRAALDKIKEYFVNVGVWIATPALHQCFHSRLWWELLFADRVVEATLLDPNVPVGKVSVQELFHIGVHARDVLGRKVGACQTIAWLEVWLGEVFIEIIPWIDPWGPLRGRQRADDPPLPLIDLQPVLDVAVGGALVGLRQAIPYPPEEMTDRVEKRLVELARKVVRESGGEALGRALRALSADLRSVGELVDRRLAVTTDE